MKTKLMKTKRKITLNKIKPDAHTHHNRQTKEHLLSGSKPVNPHATGLKRLQYEQERVEYALIRALQEWEATFNATRDPIMLVDIEFKIVQANHSSSRFFGRPLGQILGIKLHDLMYGKEPPAENCPLCIARQTDKHQDAEIYIAPKDIWCAVSVDPVINDEGQTAYFVYTIRDITYRKQAEQTLAKLNHDLNRTVQELKRSNQELRNFAHVTAHDLKSPLRGIGSIADRLIRKYNETLDVEGKEQLRLLITRVKRMSDFIDAILRYSEIGHTIQELQEVDLNVLLAEIINEISVPDNFVVNIERHLPVIRAERPRLKQVFQNLISNAVKYTESKKGKIRIYCSDENQYWKFAVEDNGCGIKKEYFEKIFEIFQTLSSRDKTESTGIGLTIVKKIVELYDGKVWVESKVRKGSTFFFTLPKNINGEKKNVSAKTDIAC